MTATRRDSPLRVICATELLDGLGGTETYVLTLADHLQRLGHDVFLYAPHLGKAAELAQDAGLRVVDTGDLPLRCDATISNYTAVAYEMAARFPSATHGYVCHSGQWAQQLPPQISDAVDIAIVMNDRVGRIIEGMGVPPSIVRLRQPIDTMRFMPQRPLPEKPRRLLLFGNYARGERRSIVETACARHNIEVVAAGVTSTPTAQPEAEINAADIVMGYGRCIIEAMACGRAAFVYDYLGGDGWVTPQSYPEMEADGFGGRGTGETITAERLYTDLARYSPEMGIYNRDLIATYHDAPTHAAAIVVALTEAGAEQGSPTVDAPLRELARMARVLARDEVHAYGLGRRLEICEEIAADRERHIEGLTETLRARDDEIAALKAAQRDENDRLARLARSLELREAELTTYAQNLSDRDAELVQFRRSRRFRLAAALAKPVDRWRLRH